MASDVLLRKFFEPERWEAAIRTAVEKGIDRSLLRDLCSPDVRISLYRQIRDGEYEIAPPHEAQIPKDDGTMRTVYVNEPRDRVLLSIANDLLFEECPEFVHPACGSYRKGIGCGRLVQDMSKKLQSIERQDPGAKIDLSKYFDSVPRIYIDDVFDRVEDKLGKSALIRMIRAYYHMDVVLDMEKQPVEKYSSLRQGCAVAAFLADAVLRHVDEEMVAMGVDYCRYSDDILILDERWEPAFERLSAMLAEMELKLNPKKIEYLDKGRWFTFLGFSMKGGMISFSPNRVASFQKEIDHRTIRSGRTELPSLIKAVEQYLYVGNGEHAWATGVLPIVNVEKDVDLLNGYAMDAIRAAHTGKARIGGVGVDKGLADHVVSRGTGRNVLANRKKQPFLPGWLTLGCMRNAITTARPAYDALAATI